MSQKPFFLGVLSTLWIMILLIFGLKSAGYVLERPLTLSDFTAPAIQSGSVMGESDCSAYPVWSNNRTYCEDNRANTVFTDYMNLPDLERLAFNCRKLLVREQQKLCVQEKSEIPKQQKQTAIMKQFANGGDITLCDNFSSAKLEQDRCRLDFILDRIPYSPLAPLGEGSGAKASSGTTPIQRKPEMKDCAIVEKYALKDQCEKEKEMMKKIESNQWWTIQPKN